MLVFTKDQERKEIIKKQLDEYDRALRLGIINQKEYEKEIHMLMIEVEDMTDRQNELNGYCEVFDDAMGNPMEKIDELVEQAKDLYDKQVHDSIEEILNEIH